MVHCPTRRFLLRWIGWFFFVNTILSFLIQTTYLRFLSDLHTISGASESEIIYSWIYLFVSYLAHASLLNFGAALIPIGINLAVPRKRIVFPVAFSLAAVLIICQLVDRIAYSIFHTHALGEVWLIFRTQSLAQVLPLSNLEMSLLALIVLLVVLFEAGIGYLVLRSLRQKAHGIKGFVAGSALSLSVLFSYGVTTIAIVTPEQWRFSEIQTRLVLRMAGLVPYYSDLYHFLIPNKSSFQRKVLAGNAKVPMILYPPKRLLQYPLNPLTREPVKQRLNILFIVVDAWRYESMNEKVTPHIAQFAKNSLQFKHHYSGGNCTKSGIFSLFYGIPAHYWNAMQSQQHAPVLLKTLLKKGYESKILGSATLRFPEFEKTVFLNQPSIPGTLGNNSIERDKAITQKFVHFLQRRDNKRPFFGFVFYDSVHNYCEGSEIANRSPFRPSVGNCARYALTDSTNPKPYLNRYYNATYFVDNQINKILTTLKQKNILDKTIVIITADHGEEFNDSQLGYWSHGTAYTRSQLQVPMIIHWPGKPAKSYHHFTSHFDIVPTLMKETLGVENPLEDYSSGGLMFDASKPHFLIASSYDDYAVITQHKVVRIYPNGDYVINQPSGWIMPDGQLDPTTMHQAHDELMRFFQQ